MNDIINNKILQSYLFYGICNKEDLLKGMIFWTNREMNQKLGGINYELPVEQKLIELKKNVEVYYKQYYRFVVQNDENITRESMQERCKNEVEAEFEKISLKLENQLNIQKAIEGLIKDNEMKPYKAGIFFLKGQEERYTGDFSYRNTMHDRIWVKDAFSVFKYLSKIEDENPEDYIGKYMEVILARAINRGDRSGEEWIREKYSNYKHKLHNYNPILPGLWEKDTKECEKMLKSSLDLEQQEK